MEPGHQRQGVRAGRAPLCIRHIHSGLGCGNIGDELMARSFWNRLPPDMRVEVEIGRWAVRQREPYPEQHRHVPVGRRVALRRWAGSLRPGPRPQAGLLVGTTPIQEAEGLASIRHVASRVRRAELDGLPVDAVGVGVEPLRSPDATALFRQGFGRVRSWTVRSEPCRQALLELGVPGDRVRIGADWAWLHRPRQDRTRFAHELWRSIGIDPGRPLLVANLVNLVWRDRHDTKRAIAAAFDRVAAEHRLQVAFYCNDYRHGAEMDGAAAREVMGLMRQPSRLVPPAYYSADEALALLGAALVTVGQRYHFIVQTVLTGTAVPVAIPRLQKMAGLVADLGCPAAGSIERVDGDELAARITEAATERAAWLARLAAARARLAARAAANLDLVWQLPPYDSLARASLPHAA